MKIIFKRLVPGMMLVLLLTVPAMAQTKIATIDVRKVFDNYSKRHEAESALKKLGTDLDKELKEFMDDYKKTQEQYTKLVEAANDQSVTLEEREKRKAAAQTKMAELKTSENTIRTFEEHARDQLDSKKKRMRDSIVEDIRVAITAKAKAGGFTLVLDTSAESAQGTPVFPYSSGENDMTDAILAQLNAGTPPSASLESPKATDKPEKKSAK